MARETAGLFPTPLLPHPRPRQLRAWVPVYPGHVAKLITGAHIESKSLDTILSAKHAIERAAGDLKAYLDTAETFNGREDLFEPS